MVEKNNRDINFDILKGIGIILMITAHTLGPESISWKYIYTFHMPLFFIASGYFFKERNLKQNFVCLYNRLIKPYLFICFIVIFLKLLKGYISSRDLFFDIEDVLYGMGPGWFLLALFWGKNIFNVIITFLPNNYLLISLFISSIPIIINFISPIDLPSEILQGFSCVIYIAIGYFTKQKSILNILIKHLPISILISFILWINTSINGKVEMASCTSKLWIIDYLGACGGTFLCYYLSIIINRFSISITQLLSKISQYSLAIISFHAIDFCIPMWYLLSKHNNSDYLIIYILFGRFVIIFISIFITAKIPFLYHLFIGKEYKGS